LDTVTEKTYESVNATCSDANIAGTLTFNKLVKLYVHKYFSKYPQFQLTELVGTKSSSITNNSTFVKGRFNKGKGKGKGRGSYSPSYDRSQHSKGKGRAKGTNTAHPDKKGKGPRKQGHGQRNQTPTQCSHCHKDVTKHENVGNEYMTKHETHGHTKKEQNNNAQHITPLEVDDETSMMFRNNATFTFSADSPTRDLPDGGEERSRSTSQDDNEDTATENQDD
jgi:hypothetical protein